MAASQVHQARVRIGDWVGMGGWQEPRPWPATDYSPTSLPLVTQGPNPQQLVLVGRQPEKAARERFGSSTGPARLTLWHRCLRAAATLDLGRTAPSRAPAWTFFGRLGPHIWRQGHRRPRPSRTRLGWILVVGGTSSGRPNGGAGVPGGSVGRRKVSPVQCYQQASEAAMLAGVPGGNPSRAGRA